jgi:surface antigen
MTMLKRLLTAGLLGAAALSTAACMATARGAYGPGYGSGYGYGGAEPAGYGRSGRDCTGQALTGAAIGAILGGIIGNQFGNSGDDRGIGAVVGMALGGAAGAAAGQSQCDEDYAATAWAESFEEAPYQRTEWQNPYTGNYGYVTPGEWYDDGYGNDCREFEQTIFVDGRRQLATGTACRRQDGSWEIVS